MAKRIEAFDGTRVINYSEGKEGVMQIEDKDGYVLITFEDGRRINLYSPFMKLYSNPMIAEELNATLDIVNQIEF